LNITSSRFVRAATKPDDEPKAPGPDLVFLGRSNVGKSSLINRLLGTKGLARTSSRPGRTQSVNFYRVNDRCWFVDLPGYGWARVPEAIRRAWKPMVEGYLERRRERIALAFLVIDARHKAQELDLSMHEWLEEAGVPYLIAATKSDKLKQNERSRSLRGLRESYEVGEAGIGPLLVSSETGDGTKELWRHTDAALETWWDKVGQRAGAPRPVPR
jgi:GTP-binding protein